MRYARIGLMAFSAVALIAGSACDDETQDKAEKAVEDVKEKAGEAGARGTAEAYRVSLKAQDTEGVAGVRNVEVLRTAAQDLPGDPDISGIADADGDGLDDDGYVEVHVGDASACVTLPESGDDVEVSGGACPTNE